MRTSVSIAATVGVVLAATVQAAPASSEVGRPDSAATVRDWNAVAVATLVTAVTPVPEQPLHLAAVHRAVYDAVLAGGEHEQQLSVPAAVSAAAYTVLVAEFPAQTARLDQELATALVGVTDGPARDAGLRAGRAAAARVLHERAGDGRDGPVLPVPPAGPGVWAPTPPNTAGTSSWLGNVRPFVLRSGSQLRPSGPPSLASARWARD